MSVGVRVGRSTDRSGKKEPVEEDMEVRSTIQTIFAGHKRRYGYRRVSAELRRRGMPVNHKRVARLMREDNLLAVQPRAFVVTTGLRSTRTRGFNLGQPHEADGRQPALGGRHHLHPTAPGVRALAAYWMRSRGK